MGDRQKILIVDDREENLYALEKVLETVDADIIRAISGNDALIAVLNHEFAVAILDVQMPEMDGYELAEHLRDDEKTRNLPIIFLTAFYSDEHHVFKGYKAGAVDFVSKPYQPEILLSKVNIFLQLDRQRRDLQKAVETEKAKSHLENILLSMSDAVLVVSGEGFIETVNEAALLLFGYSHSEIIGMPFADLFEKYGVVSEKILFSSQDMKSTAYHNKELTVFTKHGTGIPVLISGSAFHDKDKQFLGTVVVARDVREKKKAEEALKERTKTLNDILEKAGDGICVCHDIPEWPFVRFTHWNPRMTEICGYTIDEINRLGWYQTIYPDPEFQQKAIERMAKMRNGDDMLAEEWVITDKAKTQKIVSISTTILKEDNGSIHVLALMQDISDRKSAEKERLAKEKLLGVLETAGAVCHELNQPLQAISGFTELILLDLDDNDPLRERINHIIEQTNRLVILTRKFMEITRYQSKLYDSDTKILDLDGTHERRKHKRRIPRRGVVASIGSDSLHEVSIIDISENGLAFYYDAKNQLSKSGLLTLHIPDGSLHLGEIPYGVIYGPLENGATYLNNYRRIRAGVQFNRLNADQLKQLEEFLTSMNH